jgi:DNA-binding transcriptional LysR family regulator
MGFAVQDDQLVHRLKLRELRILIAVTQAKSMGKAATQLAISQPAVSRAIADMESWLGVSLLDRSPQGVAPTPFGRALIDRSVAAFDELRQGVRDIGFLADPTAGEVRIASNAPLSASFVSAVIDHISRRYPRITFHAVVSERESLYRELSERSVDLLFARRFHPVRKGQFDFESLYDDPFVVAAGVNNPWVRRRRIELAELVNELWVLPPPDATPGSFIMRAFRARGLELPRPNVVTYPLAMRCSLLATGRFLTILPRSVLRFPTKHPFIEELPVELPIASGPIGIVTLKNCTPSPVAELVVESAREVAKPLAKRK